LVSIALNEIRQMKSKAKKAILKNLWCDLAATSEMVNKLVSIKKFNEMIYELVV